MAETIKIHGMDGVRKALRKLPKELQKKELLRALRPGANIVKKSAQAMAPTGDEGFYRKLRGKAWTHYIGTLKNSIVVRAEKKKYDTGTATLRVGVLHSNKDLNVGAWYWRFVEFGTSKMPAANGGRGFLVPAFEMTKYAADKAIKNALLKAVDRVAKKVKGR